MTNKLMRTALLAALTAMAPGVAYATQTCADYTARTEFSNGFDFTTTAFPFDVAIGDSIAVELEYYRFIGAADTATLTFNVGSQSTSITAGVIGTTGTAVFAPITATDAGYAYIDTVVPNTPNSSYPYVVFVQCTPGGGGGGDPDPDPDPVDPDESAALDDLQRGYVRSVGRSYVVSAGLMAGGSVDAAFGAGTTETLALGYSGAVVMDATPAELSAAGYTLWSAGRYEVAIPGASWSGGQVNGAAGINYRVIDDLMLGVFATAGTSSHSDGTDDVSSRGLGIGALAAYRLDDMWQVQVIAGAQRLSYEIASGGTSGAFDATLLSLDASLKGLIPISAQVDFEPVLGVMVLSESQDAYTDSASVAHAAQSFLSGEVTAGGLFKYYPLDSAMVISAGGFGSYGTAGLSGSIQAGVAMDLAPSVQLGLNTSLSNTSASVGVTLSGSL